MKKEVKIIASQDTYYEAYKGYYDFFLKKKWKKA